MDRHISSYFHTGFAKKWTFQCQLLLWTFVGELNQNKTVGFNRTGLFMPTLLSYKDYEMRCYIEVFSITIFLIISHFMNLCSADHYHHAH